MAQMNESKFVDHMKTIIEDMLQSETYKAEAYVVKRGEKLRYQSAFETVSKFETDLCVFDAAGLPRVVFEFKTSPTTHDVMVYSQKADDHKRIYPQLVYGMIAERGEFVATKLWKHNRHMDFALYLGDELSDGPISQVMSECLKSYLEESKLREKIAKGESKFRGIFRKTTVREL